MAKKTKPAWNWNEDYSHLNHSERFANIDKIPVYRTLEQHPDDFPRPQDDPLMMIDGALWVYLDIHYGPRFPRLAERAAVYIELGKRVAQLSELIEKTGSDSVRDLSGIVMTVLADGNSDMSEDLPDEIREQVDRFMETVAYFPEFNRIFEGVVADAEQYTEDSVQMGRTPNVALNELIWRMADIYENFTGIKAEKDFSNFRKSGDATSPFLSFLGQTLGHYDPPAMQNTKAFSSTVRRVLAARRAPPS